MDSKRKDRVKEYLNSQKKFGRVLQKTNFAGKILAKNGYQIFDLHQANEDFRKVMKLDEINEIAGVYFTEKKDKNGKVSKVEHIVSITKSNYWNAFYLPIWKNLSISERIKSLEWMFEEENESRKLGIKNISYLPFSDDFVGDNINGYFVRDFNSLYLNLANIVEDDSCCNLPKTLAHELMHARQYQFSKYYNFQNKTDLYTLSQTYLQHVNEFSLILDYKLNDATIYALYRISKSEKVAELEALKTLKKFFDLNEKQFGTDREQKKLYNALKKDVLFDLTNRRNSKYKLSLGILSNEKVILKGQGDNLLKLLLLKSFYEDENASFYCAKKVSLKEIELLKQDLDNKKIDKDKYDNKLSELNEDVERLSQYIEENDKKLEMIKTTFLSTLKNGKLPEDFDKTEFDAIKLVDEPEKKYSLPKWLRKDEEKYLKKFEEKEL